MCSCTTRTAFFDFEENDLVLPIEVIDELDHFKRETDEKGRNARQIIRTLDELRTLR
jgi:PhoH-like ATPase